MMCMRTPSLHFLCCDMALTLGELAVALRLLLGPGLGELAVALRLIFGPGLGELAVALRHFLTLSLLPRLRLGDLVFKLLLLFH